MEKREQLVKIKLRSVCTTKQFHLLLMRSLDFPDWYGRNWDAFWDSISRMVEMPYMLRFVGWEDFALRLPQDAEVMRRCFETLSERYPQCAPQVEYR
jgi:ribonuclease inhibitor